MVDPIQINKKTPPQPKQINRNKFSDLLPASNTKTAGKTQTPDSTSSIPDYEQRAKDSLPYPELIEWNPTGYAYPNLKIGKKITLPDDVKTLYPATPQQNQKKYHTYDHGTYKLKNLEQSKELAKTEAAKITSKGNKKYTLASHTAVYQKRSDVYFYMKDGKKHFVRAASQEVYFKNEESIGHGYSLGRTMYPKPDAEYQKEMYPGSTYPVAKSEFVEFYELTSEETGKLKCYFRNAKGQGCSLNSTGLLFLEPAFDKSKGT